jgi:hypothetical protein
LSCGIGDTQLGFRAVAIFSKGSAPTFGRRGCRDFFRSKDDPPAANPATPLLTFALDFRRKESVITNIAGSRFSAHTPAWQAPMRYDNLRWREFVTRLGGAAPLARADEVSE